MGAQITDTANMTFDSRRQELEEQAKVQGLIILPEFDFDHCIF